MPRDRLRDLEAGKQDTARGSHGDGDAQAGRQCSREPPCVKTQHSTREEASPTGRRHFQYV